MAREAFDSRREPGADDEPSRIAAETPWYELFSRGARDWLRHNQKVRERSGAVCPICSRAGLLTRPQDRTVLVPIRMLEHARFRLATPTSISGAGQGKGEAGEMLRPAQAGASAAGRRDGGSERRRIQVRARAENRRHPRLAVGRAEAARPETAARLERRRDRIMCVKAGTSAVRAAPGPAPHAQGSGQAARGAGGAGAVRQ